MNCAGQSSCFFFPKNLYLDSYKQAKPLFGIVDLILDFIVQIKGVVLDLPPQTVERKKQCRQIHDTELTSAMLKYELKRRSSLFFSFIANIIGKRSKVL